MMGMTLRYPYEVCRERISRYRERDAVERTRKSPAEAGQFLSINLKRCYGRGRAGEPGRAGVVAGVSGAGILVVGGGVLLLATRSPSVPLHI
jgi:hypothetical protein